MARAVKTPSSRRRSAMREANKMPRRGNSAWTIRRAHGLEIVESREMAKLDWLVHGFSTRSGGESLPGGEPVLNLGFTDWDERASVAANRAKFTADVAANKMTLVTLRQIHSDV